jgi:HEAT repeat protein
MAHSRWIVVGALILVSACSDVRHGERAGKTERRAESLPPTPSETRSHGAESAAPEQTGAALPAGRWERDPAEETRVLRALDLSIEEGELAELIRLAREDPSPAVREAAVVTLGDSDEGRAIDALIAAAEDAERRVALAAIAQLAFKDDRQARSTLERLAASGEPAVAAAAREALEP